MHIFLTGATGFVGKHLLYYILKTTQDISVTIPVREKKGYSSHERFTKEFIQAELFKGCDMSRITMITKDIETIEKEDVSGVSCFVHCAASVQFNKPLDSLLKDNYEPVKRLHALCKDSKFVYISTCYTHPKTLKEPGKPLPIEKDLLRDTFICDYAYTKYIAEQYLYDQTSEIDIVRLSCVGAPLEDLPPMRGPAHLSILEIAYRKSLSDIWFPDMFQFSVVPVDIVCKNLIEVIQTPHPGLSIKQYAAPSESKTYNISAIELAGPIFEDNNITYWKNMPYTSFITAITVLYFCIPSLLKKIIDVNYIISAVSSNIVFESSIELPRVSKGEYLYRTRQYVQRLVQENPKPQSEWIQHLYSFFLWIKSWLIKQVMEFYK